MSVLGRNGFERPADRPEPPRQPAPCDAAPHSSTPRAAQPPSGHSSAAQETPLGQGAQRAAVGTPAATTARQVHERIPHPSRKPGAVALLPTAVAAALHPKTREYEEFLALNRNYKY